MKRNTALIVALMLLITGSGLVLAGDAESLILDDRWGQVDENLPICTIPGDALDPVAIPDGEGGLLITWRDYRESEWDIFAQRLDRNGNPLWTPNGTVICTESGHQTNPLIVPDGEGGAIITWQDWDNIFGQRVNGKGHCLWAYNGKRLMSGMGLQGYDMIPDPNGGFITVISEVTRVWAARFDNNGDMIWTPPMPILSDSVKDKRLGGISGDGEGGLLVTWVDDPYGAPALYGQYLNSTGSEMWADNGVQICTYGSGITGPKMITDGMGGAYVAWVDGRALTNWDIYAQGIDDGGNMLWEENGTVVCNTSGTQGEVHIISDVTGGFYTVFTDFHDGKIDIVAQRVDRNGTRLWPDEGKAIFDAPDSVHANYLQVLQDPLGGAVVAWMDARSGYYDIFVQRMDEGGDLLWPEDGMVVSNASLQQSLNCMVMDEDGSLFFLWSDNRDDHPKRDIYAQRLGLYLQPFDFPIKVYEDQVFYEEMHSNDDVNCTWSLITDADWLSIDSETGIITGVPDNYDVGWVHATVIATDHWARTVQDFDFEVANIKPTLLLDPHLTAFVGTPYYADLGSTEDGEGDMLWTIETDANWLNMDPVNGTLNGTPAEDDIGTFMLKINIDDGNPGGISSYHFIFKVLGANHDPVIINFPLPNAVEDREYNYNLRAEDADEGTFFFWRMFTSCSWLDLDERLGRLYGTPSNEDVGTGWLNVTVYDGSSGSDGRNYSINIINVNDPPVITTNSTLEFLQGEDIDLSLIGWDEDGDNLTWNWSGAPEWMELNRTGGLISGIPSQEDVGMHQFTVMVSDVNGGNASMILYITVVDVNEAPMITVAHIPNGTEGVPFTFLMSAQDPDGDSLTWTIIDGPDWIGIDPATGLMTGTPFEGGTYNITLMASDPSGLNDTVTVTFQIEEYLSPADDDGPPADDDDDTPTDDDAPADDDGVDKGAEDKALLYAFIAVLLVTVVILALLLLLGGRKGEEEEKWGEE